MSTDVVKKKKDEHNRKRDVIVNFRMSPEERKELDIRVNLSGRVKQEYMIQSTLCQKIVVIGNKAFYEKIKERLEEIEPQLHKISAENIDQNIMTELRIIVEMMDGWKK